MFGDINSTSILLGLIGLLTGIIIAFVFYKLKSLYSKEKAEKIVENALKEADSIKREAILEAKEEVHNLKLEAEKEIKEQKQALVDTENRLLQREQNLDRRDTLLNTREENLEQKEVLLESKQQKLTEMESKMEEVLQSQVKLLEEITNMKVEDAKKILMQRVEEQMSTEISKYIKEQEEQAKIEVDKKAKDLLVRTMQKYAADVTNENTVKVVNLPNDEMKGRLIGREGRNIRAIEAVTGVDLIIDDTPEAVVLSSFDPLRREIAALTIEALIKDGRIHPARIEEIYEKVSEEVNQRMQEMGQEVVFDLAINKPHAELIKLLGRLHFRTSYGQNVLQHSKEVAHLTGIMAAELGENVELAKRAGLFHDIGKAIDHEVEGSHVQLGVEIAKKYGESDVVINAIASHHGDEEPNNLISILVAISDALSASRPGARSDSLENYIKRLEQLENITNGFEGVEKSYAIQAGRELRIIVKPNEIDDLESINLARKIKEKIEEEMQYPGTIKVTVIRETRAIEEAK